MASNPAPVVTSSTLIVKLFLEAFGTTPEKHSLLLKGTGISARDLSRLRSRIPARAELAFVSNVSKLMGDDWVWRHADIWKSAPLGVLGKAVLNAPNRLESIGILARLGHLWAANLYFEVFKEHGPNGPAWMLAVDMVSESPETNKAETDLRHCAIILVFHMFNQKLKGAAKGLEISIPESRETRQRLIRAAFGVPVNFGRNRVGFVLAEQLCEQSNDSADPMIFKKSLFTLNQLSGSTRLKGEFERNVQNYLAVVRAGRPNADEVARWLGVSQRTLNRRLQDAGTSFRALLEASLERRARKLLAGGHLSRADISERLGYQDQASFSRALKRWKTNA